ncbi:ABC transporter substrate-binding protein [Thalassotalea litorea]|uniref:ABC transporter substrate-binding protein n=1 Tax=Thalassotalea litorea TaxID=2020715 RepID=A0A5R9IH30_9GAMM|nr:ABC transporter substrate-binding protein [Thalassotalea litorea]TLU64844.1 ABC transporter substrate-binding protein [Thalassotalea litorea]
MRCKWYWLITSVIVFISGCEPTTNEESIFNDGLVYCSEGSPTSFNPQLVTSGTTIDATTRQLYNRLIDFNRDNYQLEASLARSWHVTNDGTMITFYLRKDVQFHQTRYFTPSRNLNADDVIFSFQRILDKTHPFYQSVRGNFPFFQSINFEQLVTNIEKIDDYTIRFKLNQPDASFLSNVGAPFAVILSKEYADQLLSEDDPAVLPMLDSLPIGTGPFKFNEYRSNALIRFQRNENYWAHDVGIETLIFNITPNNTGRLTKLLTNECDVISYPIAPQEIRSRENLRLEEVTSFNVAFMAFNTSKPPFDNPVVRKAVSLAVNREAIINAVYFDQAEIAHSLLPSASWAYDKPSELLPYAPEQAKLLLQDAGLSEGFTLDLWAMPVQRAYNPNAMKMAKLIRSDLGKIGINVNIITYEWTTFLGKLANSEHQAVLIGWAADHPDPDNFFSPLLSCSSARSGSNRSFWCNQNFDDLLAKALLTRNNKKRREYYLQAQELLTEELPLLPIAHAKRAQAKVETVQGNILAPFGGISFADTKKVTKEEN